MPYKESSTFDVNVWYGVVHNLISLHLVYSKLTIVVWTFGVGVPTTLSATLAIDKTHSVIHALAT